MDFNLSKLVSKLNGERIFCLSENDLGDKTILKPEENEIDAPPLLKNAKSDLDDLDVGGLKKIPFYNSINDALRCYGKEFTQKEFYVYTPTEKYSDIDIVKNKDLVKLTPVFKYMSELWVLDELEVECSGMIKIYKTDNEEINFCKGWDWKWVGYSQNMADTVRCFMNDINYEEKLKEAPVYMKKLIEKLRLNKIPKEEMIKRILSNPSKNIPITDTTISSGDFVPVVKINGSNGKTFTIHNNIKYISLDDKVIRCSPLPWNKGEDEVLNFVTINNGYIYVYLNK